MSQRTEEQKCGASCANTSAKQNTNKGVLKALKTALLVFVLPPYLLWTPLLQKCRVPSRICTYQSHAPLSKGGRPRTLKPQNNERIEGQISITLSIALALNCSYWPGEKSFSHISTWRAHSCRWIQLAKVKGRSAEKERKLEECKYMTRQNCCWICEISHMPPLYQLKKWQLPQLAANMRWHFK